MKKRAYFTSSLLLFGLLSFLRSAVAGDLAQEMVLYCPFDGASTPAFAVGSGDVKPEQNRFGAGKSGQALLLEKAGDQLSIPAAANFDRLAGTVAFWVRLPWKLEERAEPAIKFFEDAHFRIVYDGSKRLLFFMTGRVVPNVGYKWDYQVASTEVRKWKPGEWHHVAVSWSQSNGEKTLYLDGGKVSSAKADAIFDTLRRDDQSQYLKLGGASAPADFDELAIWKRPLSDDEVLRLAQKPVEAANELKSGRSRAAARKDAAPLFWDLVIEENPSRLVVKAKEPISMKLPVWNRTAEVFNGTVSLRLLDFWEKTVDLKQVPLRLAPGERSSLDLVFSAPENGVFKVATGYSFQGKTWTKDVFAFAAWPEPKPDGGIDSFFGSHIASFREDTVAMAVRLGDRWNRDHNMLQTTWWPRQEPNAGEWSSVAEHMLDYQKKYGIKVLGQFFGTPYWAAADGKALPVQPGNVSTYPYPNPPNLDRFAEYVRRTVTKYKDYIHCWEIWNEPDVSLFWNGTPTQFAELAKVAYENAKAADPGCTVLLGGFTCPAWRWHEEAAKAGAFKYADILSIHYGCYMIPPEENDRQLKAVLEHFQGLLVKYGPGKKLPIWSTEAGTDTTTWMRGLEYPFLPPEEERAPLNWHKAAIRVVQGNVIHQLNGIQKHFYYFQNPVKINTPALYQNTSLMDVTGAPKPLWIARRSLAEQVDGASFRTLVKRKEARFWANLYENAATHEIVAVCWAGEGGVVELQKSLPGKLGYVGNIMGNEVAAGGPLTITEEPLYLRFQASLAAVTKYFETGAIHVVAEPIPLDAGDSQDMPHTSALPDYVAVKEVPGREFIVDLRSVANAGLADDVPGDRQGGWVDQGPLNDARDLPVGRQEQFGVPWEIVDPAKNKGKSVLVLKGASLTKEFPGQIGPIPVGDGRQNIRALYFLQACAWSTQRQTIGKYIVHYQSGKEVEAPLIAGTNVEDWWHGGQEGEESRVFPFRSLENQTGRPQWRYLRLWEWQNPTPQDPVVSFDFVSAGTEATPILLAVTALKVP